MTRSVLAAIDAVATVLDRENAALAAMDLRQAAACAEDKRRAVAALAALDPAAPLPPAALGRLQSLTQRNRALLERGLAAQGRVIGLIAAAAQSARRDRPGHGARYTGLGRPATSASQGLAISTRI